MATDKPGNVVEVLNDSLGPYATSAASATFVSLNPSLATHVHVKKNSEAIRVEGTLEQGEPDTAGTRVFFTLSDDATDYVAGDTKGLQGLRIGPAPSGSYPMSGSVDAIVIQTKDK